MAGCDCQRGSTWSRAFLAQRHQLPSSLHMLMRDPHVAEDLRQEDCRRLAVAAENSDSVYNLSRGLTPGV